MVALSNLKTRVMDKLARQAGYYRPGPKITPHAIEALMKFRDLLPEDQDFRAFMRYAAPRVERSYSQVFQDLFVLFQLNEKRGGYFVEFGAADGIFLSNTKLLEADYGWSGIVAEPSKGWHAPLIKNRTCHVDLRCVWEKSGDQLEFLETDEAEYSTISEFKDTDHLSGIRAKHKSYSVETVSLNDLLDFHQAPTEMDYLSIDTEGSELKILQSFDFSKRSFRVITCEQNKSRDAIFSLLISHGYRRVLTGLTTWDDWYVQN